MLEINNAAAVNLKRIKDNGDKIHRKIIDDRFANRQPSEEDIPTLFKLILDFITHYKSYGKSETMDTKKSILYYIGLTVGLLPKVRKYQVDMKQNIIEQYVLNGNSIWRDIEFMGNTQVPVNHPSSKYNKDISMARLTSILESDLPKLEEIVITELNDSKTNEITNKQHALRKRYRQKTYSLTNIYNYTNYYREMEGLKKILRYTSTRILSSINHETKEGQYALLRLLVVIGEFVSEKNLTPFSRKISSTIGWELLIGTRNRLSHPEWDFEDGLLPKALSDSSRLSAIVKEDIPALREKILSIYNVLEGCNSTNDIDKAINNHYLPLTYQLPEKIYSDIKLLLKDIFDEGLIPEESCEELEFVPDQVRFSEKGRLTIDIMNKIRKAIGKETISEKVIESLKSDELKKWENTCDIIQRIRRALSSREKLTDNNRENVEFFLKKLLEGKLIDQAIFDQLHSNLFNKDMQLSVLINSLKKLVSQIGLSSDNNEIYKLYHNIKPDCTNEDELLSKKRTKDIRALYTILRQNNIVTLEQDSESSKKYGTLFDTLNDKNLPSQAKEYAQKKVNQAYISIFKSSLNNIPNEGEVKKHHELLANYKSIIGRLTISNESITEIGQYLTKLVAESVITDTQQNELQALLLKPEEMNEFILRLDEIVGQEKFNESNKDALKSYKQRKYENIRNQIFKLEQDIEEAIKAHLADLKEKEKEQEKVNLEEQRLLLPNIRSFRDNLSDGICYERAGSGRSRFDQLKLVNSVIQLINELEQILASLPSIRYLTEREQEFPELNKFSYILKQKGRSFPGLCSDIEFLNAVKIMKEYNGITETDEGIYITGFQEDQLTFEDTISGKKREFCADIIQVKRHIIRNWNTIKNDIISYSQFLTLVKELKKDEIKTYAVEYIMGIFFPYLNHLSKDNLNYVIDENVAKEIKFLRNHMAHGNLYADHANSEKEEFYIHYASKLIITFKPVMQNVLKIQNEINHATTEALSVGASPLVLPEENRLWSEEIINSRGMPSSRINF